MPEFKTFSFKDVNVIFGIAEIGGFGEGDDVITIQYDADQYTKTVGAKGDVTRTQTADSSCSMTLKLLQTSSSNSVLMNIFNTDRETGVGALPFIVNNKKTGETYVVNNAWIVKPPPITRGANPTTMDWALEGDFLTLLMTE